MTYYDKKTYYEHLSTLKVKTAYKLDYKMNGFVTYLDIPAGFDIETSSEERGNEKIAYMYLAVFGIGDKIFYVRTWEEFVRIMKDTQIFFGLSEKRRLVVYVHFLSFEFQFMRKWFDWVDIFAVKERQPIKAVTDIGIEFRDSYILSGLSLEKTAENLTDHQIMKLKGELDYDKLRHSSTELTKAELNYAENDVQIILDYISEEIKEYGSVSKIPLTNTGKVRQFVRNNCFYYHPNRKNEIKMGKGKRYKELMNVLRLDAPSYLMLKEAFQGGYVHTNCFKKNEVIENVYSKDETSAYPFVMATEKFPMSEPREITDWSVVDNKNRCSVFRVKLKNVHCDYFLESYLSESHCREISKGAIINDGKIYAAEYLECTLTDVDWDIVKKLYTFDYEFIEGYWFVKGYLPNQIIKSILTLYEKKTTLKGVEGKETEYVKNKSMLNSVFGMCVTDIVRPRYRYDTEWHKETPQTMEEIQECVDEANDNPYRFLYYPWGVWVTAYARRNLWEAIVELKEDYLYTDTDCVKYTNKEKHEEFFENYNNECRVKLQKMCDFTKIDIEMTEPINIKGEKKLLGAWEDEKVSVKFKMIGTKKYIQKFECGEYKLTCAGLAKTNGMNYIKTKCRGREDKIFKYFNDELYIPPNKTGNHTHFYRDRSIDNLEVTDYNGKKQTINERSCVYLTDAEFTLSQQRRDAQMVRMFLMGYVNIGVGAGR